MSLCFEDFNALFCYYKACWNKVLKVIVPLNSPAENLTKIGQLRAQLAATEAELQSQSERIAILEEVVRHLKLKRFAPSSEKTSAEQFLLFDESELCTDPDLIAFENEQDNKSGQGENDTKPRGRKPLSKDLPREQIFLYLTDEETTGAKNTFFAKVKEERDIVPAKIRVLEYMQEKAVFDDKEDTQYVIMAPMSKHPLPGSVGSVSLIAHVITAKYADGLPLYRMEKVLKRYGAGLSRTTLANYVIQVSKVLQPLINLLREQQNAGLLCDMTNVVDHFLNSIESDTPDNILLFGHSMGAILAFECARALQSSTKTSVKGLFVSACIAPSLPRSTKPIYDLPSPLCKEELKPIYGTPEGVINNQELMELIEPNMLIQG